MNVINTDVLMAFLDQNKKILLGVACCAVLVAGVLIFYGYKESRKPLSTAPSTAPIIDLAQQTSDAALNKSVILLPKSKVTVAYYASYTAIANEVVVLTNAYRDELVPLLAQAQADLAKNNIQGLEALATQASAINTTQKRRIVILSTGFDTLATINATTKDPETKSLTASFIKTGKDMLAAYSAYSALIDAIISQNTSSFSAAQAQTITNNVPTAITAFSAAAKKLSLYFGNTLANDLLTYLKTASSTDNK